MEGIIVVKQGLAKWSVDLHDRRAEDVVKFLRKATFGYRVGEAAESTIGPIDTLVVIELFGRAGVSRVEYWIGLEKPRPAFGWNEPHVLQERLAIGETLVLWRSLDRLSLYNAVPRTIPHEVTGASLVAWFSEPVRAFREAVRDVVCNAESDYSTDRASLQGDLLFLCRSVLCDAAADWDEEHVTAEFSPADDMSCGCEACERAAAARALVSEPAAMVLANTAVIAGVMPLARCEASGGYCQLENAECNCTTCTAYNRLRAALCASPVAA